jgi:23S rRNA (cytosine1962-C5)-methyltransferase
MQATAPGGLLTTCSCSGAMAQGGDFLQVLHDAARQAGRQLKILRTSGAGSDHPLLQVYPEGRYLSAVTVQVV